MLRLAFITGFVLLGLSSALSQESKATQAVNFAVRRADAPLLLSGMKHKAATNGFMQAKVTVLFDVPEKTTKGSSVRAAIPHLDADLVRSEELQSAFRKRSFLVTITD